MCERNEREKGSKQDERQKKSTFLVSIHCHHSQISLEQKLRLNVAKRDALQLSERATSLRCAHESLLLEGRAAAVVGRRDDGVESAENVSQHGATAHALAPGQLAKMFHKKLKIEHAIYCFIYVGTSLCGATNCRSADSSTLPSSHSLSSSRNVVANTAASEPSRRCSASSATTARTLCTAIAQCSAVCTSATASSCARHRSLTPLRQHVLLLLLLFFKGV